MPQDSCWSVKLASEKRLASGYLKRNLAPPDTETHSFKPVVVTVTPAGATEKGLLSALLKTLGCPRPDRGSSVSMYQRAIDLIEILETRIIIFDEIQHLSERNALKKTLPVVNLIKNIMTETNCPIVLVGMPDSIDLLNEKQLDRRFMKSLTLKPFSMSDTPVTNDFTESDVYFSFLNTITSILPIETINLLDPNVARRLLAASSGKIAILIKIFAALIENNDAHLATLNDFSLAFHDIADHDAKHCPFLISTAKLESMYF